MLNLKLFTATSLLALSGIANSVHASEFSVFIGTACQPFTSDDGENLAYLSDNLQNMSDDTAYVSCPIMRRNVTNLTGTANAYAVVQSHNSGTVTCGFHSRTRDGRFSDFRSNSTTSSSVTQIDLDIDASAPFGTYSLFCTLPPKSRIYSYGIEEFEIIETPQTLEPASLPVLTDGVD